MTKAKTVQRTVKQSACTLPPMLTLKQLEQTVFSIQLDDTAGQPVFEAIAFDKAGKLWHWKRSQWVPITLGESAEWYVTIETALVTLNSSETIQQGYDSIDWYRKVGENLTNLEALQSFRKGAA